MRKTLTIKTKSRGNDAEMLWDGVDIKKSIVGFKAIGRAGHLTEVTLDLCVNEFEFSGESGIKINTLDIPESLAKAIY